ncbi:exodeoxyribonuclease V subunit beta [Zoogloea sp.]|uniref:exodeoxyribonuclease V subunit beta n=1 Tax=Zoogloea sp. TaxID=49181 RepID=UPI0035B4405A
MSPNPISSPPVDLVPLAFPLRGSRLIEASAGTGKTFTIALLYVRLVLGHGDDAAFGRELTPPEILVVTFTDAATKELRDRIRARLTEAAGYFLADPAGLPAIAPGKDPLHDLRAAYPPEAWPGCARKLQLAAEWMDEAAVSTIHGWCNRMLREHAFDSDSLFTQTLETNQDELLAEVVRDYWRSFMYPLDIDAAAVVHGWWASPEALQGEVKKLLLHADLLDEALAPATAVAAAEAEKQRQLGPLKAPWGKWVDELRDLFDAARDAKQVDGRKLRKDYCDGWLAALAAWRDDPAMVWPALSDSAWKRLSPDGLAEAWKGNPVPAHPALAAIFALPDQLVTLPDARDDVLRHAADWVAQRFAAEQARHAKMGFNDLLTRLDAALSGANGDRLAQVIRAQFPVALIDEFQDTDAVQYRIFDAVYRVADNDESTGLILIGDPKQAIYAFRGADIYTYLAARAATAGRHYTLRRNFRSTHAMVAAANRCFALAEERDSGAGAFLFRSAAGNPVPFLPAEANGREDVLQAEGAELPALTLWRLPPREEDKPLSKGHYVADMAAVCASEMVRLLNLGQQGQAGFFGKGEARPLRPAHMAVLVSNGGEATAIREALAARGVRSVYLSEKESVFQRPEAVELQHWLSACAEPDDGRLLRAALATPTLGLDWAELDGLNRDETAWDKRIDQFRAYRECWRSQGVLPMLRRLLNDFRVPARLLAGGGVGERRLTDLLHLAELLQQASLLLDGEHALIRHLAEQRREDSVGGDTRQVRLESDADLVQVVTIHKSKGLEYPLVFLPFACTFRPVKADDLPLKWHDDDGHLQLALNGDDPAQLALADRERLGEDLRKLYVALTRARYATWVGTGPLDGLGQSALGYLLGGSLDGGLAELAAGDGIKLKEEPEADDGAYQARELALLEGAARQPLRAVREQWWIASYSALQTAGERQGPDTPKEDVHRETLKTRSEAPSQPAAKGGGMHDFPRGAAVGTFLHELFEWAAKQGFARVSAAPGLLRDVVARRCAARGWQRWIEPLSEWMLGFLHLPLTDGDRPPLTLAGLQVYAAEMEFLVAVHHVDLAELDALVCRHTLGGAPRPALDRSQLNGMLKGFIDLLAEHDGRYYVVDYKSNRLGDNDAAYTPEAMREAVLAERYELQYVLYLLALHRLLKLRLPDYDYDRHVGGALYLFLRGSHSASRGIHAERPPRVLIETLDALFAGARRQEAA